MPVKNDSTVVFESFWLLFNWKVNNWEIKDQVQLIVPTYSSLIHHMRYMCTIHFTVSMPKKFHFHDQIQVKKELKLAAQVGELLSYCFQGRTFTVPALPSISTQHPAQKSTGIWDWKENRKKRQTVKNCCKFHIWNAGTLDSSSTKILWYQTDHNCKTWISRISKCLLWKINPAKVCFPIDLRQWPHELWLFAALFTTLISPYSSAGKLDLIFRL